jgi:hypothetical protein
MKERIQNQKATNKMTMTANKNRHRTRFSDDVISAQEELARSFFRGSPVCT